MKVLFMGTPNYAATILSALLKEHEVVAVFTQPDRPKGRGHKLEFPPVKTVALDGGVEVFQPESLRGAGIRKTLKKFGADIFVVAAYGLILSKRVLEIPPYGCVNVHASLLPKYRGASPIQAAIMAGDKRTGITIMQMDSGIDTGDIILMKDLAIEPDERSPSLYHRLGVLGAECILEALELIEKGKSTLTPQDDEASSYAPIIQKSDGMIDWHRSSERIVNLTRAMDPWPGAYSMNQGEVLKIWSVVKAAEEDISAEMKELSPGSILVPDPRRGILVRTGDEAVWVTEVQAPGRKRMSVGDYLRGSHSIKFTM